MILLLVRQSYKGEPQLMQTDWEPGFMVPQYAHRTCLVWLAPCVASCPEDAGRYSGSCIDSAQHESGESPMDTHTKCSGSISTGTGTICLHASPLFI